MITIQSNREPARIHGAGTGRKHDFSDIGFTDQRLSDHHRADGSRHLAGCLLGWSFLAVTELLLAEIAAAVLVLILSGLIAHKNSIIGKPAPENSKTSGRQQILTVVLVFFILLQVLWILTGERVWTDGDMTLETVNTFLKENSIYTVDPLTGEPYTTGHVFPSEAAVPAYSVRNHQPLERYGP